MPTKEDYLALSEKVNSLKERRAILVSNEEKKASERKELLEELVKFGVDPEKPLEEIERLEQEILDQYEQAKSAVDRFEVALNDATGQTSKPIDPLNRGIEVTADLNAVGEISADSAVHNDDLDLE